MASVEVAVARSSSAELASDRCRTVVGIVEALVGAFVAMGVVAEEVDRAPSSCVVAAMAVDLAVDTYILPLVTKYRDA